MEAAKHLLHSSPPPCPTRTHSKINPSSSSVEMLNEQVGPAFTSTLNASSACHFPASVLLQEQRDDNRPLLHLMKEDKVSQGTFDRRPMGTASSTNKDSDSVHSDQYMNEFQLQMLQWPGLWYSFPSLLSKNTSSSSSSSSPMIPPVSSKTDKEVELEPCSVIALARKALSASREAAALAENSTLFDADLGDSLNSSLADGFVEEACTVRSTRLLQRRSRRRRKPKLKEAFEETNISDRPEARRKRNEAVDQNDALRLFLSCADTKLLTVQEECELIEKIQGLMKLEEVKSRFQGQFSREPTLVEWAEAVGLSCQALQSELHSGQRSREKLIYANFRMVVHIARQYQGRGLCLPDLLQEGSMGLMKSVEKFKPQAGCRFGTYAYWWIRQTIRKAIFQHSRTIRLPDNVYGLLSKVKEAKQLCIQQGKHQPTKEEIAACAGITVEKLEKLLFTARMPLSMQQPVWADQDTTFQEITADNSIEVPDISVAKQLMRQHVRNLLNVLSPKERKIIQLRFGIIDGKPKSLSEIGAIFGLSKERVRQLESRALYKLKQRLSSHGLGAYAVLLK